MSSLVDDSVYMSELLDKLKNTFGLTDYEVEFIRQLNIELKRPTPTTRVGINNRLDLLDEYRSKLANLIFMITSSMQEYQYKYHETYNASFTRLVRAGRPSTQAIESEIHTDEAMHRQRKLLDSFENFRALLFSYMKSLDSCKSTCFSYREV